MKKTQVMGILNATPDSFFDGGLYFDFEKALKRGFQMKEEGADLIDIGGESTRPFSETVSVGEELRRVIPLVKALSPHIPLSIDTSKIEVAKAALENGATFLNDVTGFRDPHMRKLASEKKCDICLMHMQGLPETMQLAPSYPRGILVEIGEWFDHQIQLCLAAGISKEKIFLDPGIGFGKSVENNLTIIKNLSEFHSFGCPLLIGLSRKSFMQKILKKSAQDLLSTTLAMNTISILEGVQIIRVHDVKEHRDVVELITTLKF